MCKAEQNSNNVIFTISYMKFHVSISGIAYSMKQYSVHNFQNWQFKWHKREKDSEKCASIVVFNYRSHGIQACVY